MAFDPFMLALLIFYLYVEWANRRRTFERGKIGLYKRLALLAFIMPSMGFMFIPMRMESHNLIPYFAMASILACQGIGIYSTDAARHRNLLKRNAIFIILFLFISADIIINGNSLIKARSNSYRQREDVAFDIAKWWRENIPQDARIVANHYNCVYIPPGYKNVKTLNWNQADKEVEIPKLVYSYKPKFIYHNTMLVTGEVMQPLENMVPNYRLKLIKTFESAAKRYQRSPGDKFLIYEALD